MSITNQKLLSEELFLLQEEKGKLCISIIVPTHPLSPEKRASQLLLERAINRTKEQLLQQNADKEVQPLLQAIDNLYGQIDFTHNKEGVGLFVSEKVQLLIHFPFPVHEKVMIADSFEVRDLLYKISNSRLYYVLLLTEAGARLFAGEIKTIIEIKDENFPLIAANDDKYSQPAHNSLYAGTAGVRRFDKDENALQKIKHQSFLSIVDDVLIDYLVGDTPFIVGGIKSETAAFVNQTALITNLAGVLPGNYTFINESDLAEKVWPILKSDMEEKKKDEINAYEEKAGEDLAEAGLENVWRAVAEGRGAKLLVEKDFKKPGYLGSDQYKLYLFPPYTKHKVLPDAVDELIKMTLNKEGEVVFVENGMLKNQQHIALITRY